MQNLVTIENPAVELVNGKAVVLSQVIASHFGKSHYNVLRDIQALECSSEFRELNFEGTDYVDKQGKNRPSFSITRDGFVFLVMGWTGPKAARFKEAYIRRFNELEAANKLLPDESKIKTRDLALMARHASELVNMQRRVIRLQSSLIRVRSMEVRRLGGVPAKPAAANGQMVLPL